MNLFFIGAALLAGFWFLRELGRTPAHKVKQFKQKMSGYGLFAIAGYFALHGNFMIALPLIGFGAGLVGWQQVATKFSQSPPEQPPSQAQNSTMDKAEALQILGLKEGASREEINAAYKRLQRANHPDAGGSTYLAVKINQARDTLLK